MTATITTLPGTEGDGYVRIVDVMGDDLSVVRAARVSHDADWRTGKEAGKDEKLIRYMMRNGHTSPFEHVVFTFEVKAPIFVLRQWMRHRTFSYNEHSARYSDLDEGFYIPDVGKIGSQSSENKQKRVVSDDPPEYGEELLNARAAQSRIQEACDLSLDIYQQLIHDGVPREIARSVLPTAAYSRMFATVDLHNMLKFLGLRMNHHAQYEIQVYAEAMYNLIYALAPVSVQAWRDYTLAPASIPPQSGTRDD